MGSYLLDLTSLSESQQRAPIGHQRNSIGWDLLSQPLSRSPVCHNIKEERARSTCFHQQAMAVAPAQRQKDREWLCQVSLCFLPFALFAV